MSSFSDSEYIQRLFVARDQVTPEILGRGPFTIRGSAYMQGPNLLGNDKRFPGIWAGTMIGPMKNADSPPPFIPGAIFTCSRVVNRSPYSLAVWGNAIMLNHLDVNRNVTVGGSLATGLGVNATADVTAWCGIHRLSLKKNFDIEHPTKEGWRLTHSCVEGPEAAVYFRGRVTNSTEIDLPSYWKKLVDIQSITVSLTPIGAHQDVIVKRWDNKKIYLQSKGGMPIDCFYHIYGERIDTEKLIPEYKGTIEDYPGDNSQRSIAGYNYDKKEE